MKNHPFLSLFLIVQKKSKYVVGTALNMAESDGVSYFYYATIPENPNYSFIKYSSQRSEDQHLLTTYKNMDIFTLN